MGILSLILRVKNETKRCYALYTTISQDFLFPNFHRPNFISIIKDLDEAKTR